MTASERSLPSKRSTSEPYALAVLQAENERLITLLEANGIDWRLAPEPATSPSKPESSRLSTEAKVALFRGRLRGRTDVYHVRWESKTTGKSGYAPACANERRAGVCEKPRIKCGLGKRAHAWIVFADRVPARGARRLSTAVVSHTCARTRQLKLVSYDRLFANEDTIPKGGFGNLIALLKPREEGFTVFVDSDLRPHPEWEFLASIKPTSPQDIEPTILRATDGAHPLDMPTFVDDEDLATPWRRATRPPSRTKGAMPKSLTETMANLVYFEKAELPRPLANRLIRLAAFQNPEFYRAQATRLSVWDKPRMIGCAENYPRHMAVPVEVELSLDRALPTGDQQ